MACGEGMSLPKARNGVNFLELGGERNVGYRGGAILSGLRRALAGRFLSP